MTNIDTIARRQVHHTTCPHDCPSACALVADISEGRLTRLRGAKEQTYTAGVICAKTARYAERVYHPERILYPLRRIGPKGAGQFVRISWDEALTEIADRFLVIEKSHGSEAVWPYSYAGSMGRITRDGLRRLTNAKRYSRFHQTICINMAFAGFAAGTGKLIGPDPREMAKSDLIVLWGTNAVATQVNVMTHVAVARKTRNAKVVVVDVYGNATTKQADMALLIKPGTDGALACAVMHILFRDGYADRPYLEAFSDCPGALEQHLQTRDAKWASDITGLTEDEIETFAKLIGTTQHCYLRLGYGFTRSRNGAANMHAVVSIATVAGLWKHEGGGAFHNNADAFHLKQTFLEASDTIDPSVRFLDQSRIGAILTGDLDALKHGPPVMAMLIQNTNPMSVAPDQTRVKEGFARDDLYVVVHEQFMTETASMADIVLPATMFVEHDDFYDGPGHQYLGLGNKLLDAPGECKSNHDLVCALAERLHADHPVFKKTALELIDITLVESGWQGGLAELTKQKWIDAQPDFAASHYLDGFAWPDGKFRFRPDWPNVPFKSRIHAGPVHEMPTLPDHWSAIENANENHPFRLVTAPARNFLNSSFNETPTSLEKEGAPFLMIHPDDASSLSVNDGDEVNVSNARGVVRIKARVFADIQRGVVVTEGIWANRHFFKGNGINTLTGADPVAPYGGAAFHDNSVSIEKTNA